MVKYFVGLRTSFHNGVVYRSLDEDSVRQECLNRCRIVARRSVLEPGTVLAREYEACRDACQQEHGSERIERMKNPTLKKCRDLAQDDDDLFARCCRENGLRYRPVDDAHPVKTSPPPIFQGRPYSRYEEIRDKTWYPDSLLYSCFDGIAGQCLYGVDKERCREIAENAPYTTFAQHLETEKGGVCIPFMLSNARWYANNRTPIENLVPTDSIDLGKTYRSTVYYDPRSFESFLTGNFYLAVGNEGRVAEDGTIVVDKGAAAELFVHDEMGHNIINLDRRHVYLFTLRKTNNTLVCDLRGGVLVFMPIVNQKNTRLFSYDKDRFFPYLTIDVQKGNKKALILSFLDTRRVPYKTLGYLLVVDQKLVFSRDRKTLFHLEKAPVPRIDTKTKNALVRTYYEDFLAQIQPPTRSFPWWCWVLIAAGGVCAIGLVLWVVLGKK